MALIEALLDAMSLDWASISEDRLNNEHMHRGGEESSANQG